MPQLEPGDPWSLVLPFDWPWEVNETILACTRCTPWRAELFLVGTDRDIWIREWHALACPVWSEVEGLNA